jgi:hypothetical protein
MSLLTDASSLISHVEGFMGFCEGKSLEEVINYLNKNETVHHQNKSEYEQKFSFKTLPNFLFIASFYSEEQGCVLSVIGQDKYHGFILTAANNHRPWSVFMSEGEITYAAARMKSIMMRSYGLEDYDSYKASLKAG